MFTTEKALVRAMTDPEIVPALRADVKASLVAAGWMAEGKITANGRRFYADHIEPDLRFARRPAFMRKGAR